MVEAEERYADVAAGEVHDAGGAVALCSEEDITSGLLGTDTWGISGYMPASAVKLRGTLCCLRTHQYAAACGDAGRGNSGNGERQAVGGWMRSFQIWPIRRGRGRVARRGHWREWTPQMASKPLRVPVYAACRRGNRGVRGRVRRSRRQTRQKVFKSLRAAGEVGVGARGTLVPVRRRGVEKRDAEGVGIDVRLSLM